MFPARWWRAIAGRHGRHGGRPVRKGLRLQELEPRRVPAAMAPDVAVLGASTPDSHVVNVSYEVDGLAEGQRLDFDLAIVRSSDDRYDGADRRVATAHVEAVGDGSGSVRGTAAVAVPGGLVPVPKRSYVLAVADPDDAIAEPDESNNVAGFRKHVIAVVTHGGIQESSYPPPWAVKLSQGLRDQGYDAVLTFTWASRSETPGAAPEEGPTLANDVLLASQTFPADEPVDLHLIGHSQGAVVTSRALAVLDKVTTPQLAPGFVRVTMLDPHAASNGAPGQFSTVKGFEGWLMGQATSAYQWLAGDPMVAVPASVDMTEVYYQHTPADLDGTDWPSNIHGQAPILGRAEYADLTGPGMAHTSVTGVQSWYWRNVVPTLGDGGGFVDPTAMTATLDAPAAARTIGEVTLTADASPTYTGTVAPGGTVRLLVQPSPNADFLVLDEATADADGHWTLNAPELPPGQYRFLLRGIVPAGEGPWDDFYPLMALGRLAIHPAAHSPALLDALDAHGATVGTPPTRRSINGPRGLPSKVPARLEATDNPPRSYRLTAVRERLIDRIAERIAAERS